MHPGIDGVLRPYIEELKQYAGVVRVPGLDVASEPVPLDDIFMEPQFEPQARIATSKSPQSPDRGPGILGLFRKKKAEPDSQDTVPEPPPKALPEPALQALAREPRIVILGEPGQEKSTLLRQHALRLAITNEPGIPLLVELGRNRDWNDGAARDFNWLYERLPESLKQPLEGEGWRLCSDALAAGRATVLLDGLDELSDRARRHVIELVVRLGENRVVLSSRPHAYRQAPLSGFKLYALGELQPRQIELLATSVCRSLAPQFGTSGADALAKVLFVGRGAAAVMARNPLLLSFMCLTAIGREAEGKIEEFPTRPAPLIGECVEALVEWHRTYKTDPTWPRNLTGYSGVKILGELALQSFQNRSGIIHAEEVEKLAEAEKAHFHGHLLPARFVEQQHRDYAFPLETFREYFAARAIAESADPYATVKHHLHSPEWQRVILYTAGCLPQRRAALLDLWLPTFTWVFVKSVGPVVRIGASLVPGVGGKVIQELGPGLNGPLERWLAHSRQSTEFFITSIWKYHCAWGRRFYESIFRRDLNLAARCLGAAGESCPDRLAVRVADTLIASEIGDSAAAEAGRHPAVVERWIERARWKRFFGRRKQPKAIVILKAVAAEPGVRKCLVELALAKDPGCRYLVANAMAGLAFDPEVRHRLLALTEDGESLTREAATEALKDAAGEPEVQERLLVLITEQNYWLRAAAKEALSAITPTPKVQQRLLELTEHENSDTREAAVKALQGAAGDFEVQRRLWELIWSEDYAIRRAAEKALASAASDAQAQEGRIEALLARTRDENSHARQVAIGLLAGIAAEQRVLERLLVLTGHEDANTRQAAAEALAGVASEAEVHDRLLAMSQDDDWSTRAAAVQALNGIASEPSVQKRLLELTHDKVSTVRDAAIEGLAASANEPEVSKRLLELTRQTDDRESAVKALASAAAEPEVRQTLLALTRCRRMGRREARARAANHQFLRWKFAFEAQRKSHLNVQAAAVEALRGALAYPEVKARLFGLTWRLEWGVGYIFYTTFMVLLMPVVLFQSLPKVLQTYLANLMQPSADLLHAYMPGVLEGSLSAIRWSWDWAQWVLSWWPLICFLTIIYYIGLFREWWYSRKWSEVGDAALKALQGWRGSVPRFVLWRVALLAAIRGTPERVETLATLLQLREEQQHRS